MKIKPIDDNSKLIAKNILDGNLNFQEEFLLLSNKNEDENKPEKTKHKLVFKILEDKEDCDLSDVLKIFFELVEKYTNMEIWIISDRTNGICKKIEQEFKEFKFFYINVSYNYFFLNI